MVSLRNLAIEFASQLLEMYESGEHIITVFRLYMWFLGKYGRYNAKHDMRRVADWQMKDMEMAIWNDKIDYTKIPLETVHNKNRRSGKTKDATRIAVFFSLLNLEVKWRSGYMRQMVMAKYWFLMNPFVRQIKYVDNSVHLYGPSIYPIDLAVLSAANVTGIECDCAFFDEGGWVFKHLRLYEAYRNARPMVAPSKCKHIIHFSTPARYSAFQEAWLEVESLAEELGTTLTVLRTDEDCPWITPEFVEYERRMNADCPWYVDQNYKGIWVVYGGAVFNNFYDINDLLHVPQEIRDKWSDMRPDRGGVDWNGEITKHYLVLGKLTPNYVLVKEELKFIDINFLEKYMRTVSIEMEDDDPFSDQYADTAKELGILGAYFGWDMPNKMERVRQVQIRTVIIDKAKCPTTWRNFQEAAHDKNSRLPALEKRPDQHGLDGVLHMIHPEAGGVHYMRMPKRKADSVIW